MFPLTSVKDRGQILLCFCIQTYISLTSGFEKDIVAVNVQLEYSDRRPGVIDAFAVGEPELPAMPGTNQLAVFERSFGKWAALVGTNAAHRDEGSMHIGNTGGSGAEQKFASFAFRWKLRDRGDAHRVVHSWNIAQTARYNFVMFGVRN